MKKTTSYIPGNTILHHTDPRIKLIVLILLTILIFIIKTFSAIGMLFIAILLLWKLGKMRFKAIAAYLKFMTVLFVILIIMQTIFYPGETILVKPLIPEGVPLLGGKGYIALEGIVYGFLLCFRVLTLIMMLPVLLTTTTIEGLSLGMVKMGLSYKVAFTATTALNQLPILQSDIASIMNAQKLRGFTVFETGRFWQKLKAFPTLVVPLVMGSMRRANIMGVAMDSRAFGTSKKRTYIENIEIMPRDWLLFTASLVYIAGILAVNYLVGV